MYQENNDTGALSETYKLDCRTVENSVEPLGALQDGDCRSVEVVEANSSEEKFREFLEDQPENLNLSDFLHPYIAEPLKEKAELMPTSPEMLITTGLAVWLSLIGTAAKVEPWQDWQESAVLWAMVIASTGSLKSRTQEVLIDPLMELQEEAKNEYEKSLLAYKASQQNNSDHNDVASQVEPVQRNYWLNDTTMEALIKTHSSSPRGILIYQDEIDSFFQSMDKYKNGKGSDLPNWLSLNGGGSVKHTRIGRDQVEIRNTSVSITGSIQPEVLSSYLVGKNNVNGWNARWLYCYPPMPLVQYTGKFPVMNLRSRLLRIYRMLDRIKPINNQPVIFKFSREAELYFANNWYNLLAKYDDNSDEGISAVLAKWRGYCARIALALHCVNEVCEILDRVSSDETKSDFGDISALPIEELSTEISLTTIKKAIALSAYYINQAKIVFKLNTPISQQSSNDLRDDRAVKRLIEISEELFGKTGGWLKPRDALQKTTLVKRCDYVRELFKQMAENKIGETRYQDKKLEWRYTPQKASTLLQNSYNIDSTSVTDTSTTSSTSSTSSTESSVDDISQRPIVIDPHELVEKLKLHIAQNSAEDIRILSERYERESKRAAVKLLSDEEHQKLKELKRQYKQLPS